MNAIEKGIYDALIADTALVAELVDGTAVYNQIAEQGKALPYVVFFYAGGGPTNDTPSDTRNYVYAVKGIADESKKAGTIRDKIEDVLHRQTLTVAGYTNLMTFCEGEISLVETQANGANVFHRGNYTGF